jgi:hypothetical protein
MSPLAKAYYLQFAKDLLRAAILAALFGGPMFLYFLFVMKP